MGSDSASVVSVKGVAEGVEGGVLVRVGVRVILSLSLGSRLLLVFFLELLAVSDEDVVVEVVVQLQLDALGHWGSRQV